MFKRRLSINSRDAPEKRRRHHYNTTVHITRLSDELFLRIASHLSTRDLAAFQVVSKRCGRIAVDGQIWKALYYRRFVRPRASRIPGVLRDAGDGTLNYSSKNSRWLKEEDAARRTGTDWKQLYKLRHNWAIGSCKVRMIDASSKGYKVAERKEEEEKQELLSSSSSSKTYAQSSSPKPLLAKLHEGILFTADAPRGLRAWKLASGVKDTLIAETNLYSYGEQKPVGLLSVEAVGAPTALAVDEESGIVGCEGTINVTVGFENGGFHIYQLDMVSENLPALHVRYIHTESGIVGTGSSAITSMAALGPYLSTIRSQTWTIYDFSQSSDRFSKPLAVSRKNVHGVDDDLSEESGRVDTKKQEEDMSNKGSTVSQAEQIAPQTFTSTRYRMMPSPLHAPQILKSLQSCTSWPPLSISLRRSINRSFLASIIFTYPLFGNGWSVGIQELHFSTSGSGRGCNKTLLEGSRIASATKSGFSPITNSSGSFSAAATSRLPIGFGSHWSHQARGFSGPGSWLGSQPTDPPLARPNFLSYCHPYLLASHSDNTLTLFLITSSDRTLSIDPGQRLYGHTSAVTVAHVNGRGKAVSISSGSELRLWDLEGGVSERRRVNASIRVEPSHDVVGETTEPTENTLLGGFDEERVVVLKNTNVLQESRAVAAARTLLGVTPTTATITRTGTEATASDIAIMVYDFNR